MVFTFLHMHRPTEPGPKYRFRTFLTLQKALSYTSLLTAHPGRPPLFWPYHHRLLRRALLFWALTDSQISHPTQATETVSIARNLHREEPTVKVWMNRFYNTHVTACTVLLYTLFHDQGRTYSRRKTLGHQLWGECWIPSCF